MVARRSCGLCRGDIGWDGECARHLRHLAIGVVLYALAAALIVGVVVLAAVQ